MTRTTRIRFLPWEGHEYRKQAVRILILGESHYSSHREARNFTQRLTRQYIAGDWNHRFWTQVSQANTGKSYAEIDRREFWNSVALYNYVQAIGVRYSRQKPADVLFRQSEAAFFQVLDQLRPTHVLALGYRLWERLPALEDEALSFVCHGGRHQYGRYRRVWGTILATAIHHPSSGFSAPQWYPVICKFLRM